MVGVCSSEISGHILYSVSTVAQQAVLSFVGS